MFYRRKWYEFERQLATKWEYSCVHELSLDSFSLSSSLKPILRGGLSSWHPFLPVFLLHLTLSLFACRSASARSGSALIWDRFLLRSLEPVREEVRKLDCWFTAASAHPSVFRWWKTPADNVALWEGQTRSFNSDASVLSHKTCTGSADGFLECSWLKHTAGWWCCIRGWAVTPVWLPEELSMGLR